MRQSHLILSNAAIMWASRVFLLIPQLILVPFLIGTIGDAGYGVYALVWSLMVSIDQLQDSLQQGVVKYSAGFLAQQRMDEVNKVVSSSFACSIVLAVMACAGTLVAAAFYNDPSGQIGSALVVTGIMVLFIVPLTPYVAIIQSQQRYFVSAIAGTVSQYLSLGLTVAWFTWITPSVEALIIIMAGMLFFTRLAQVPVAYYLVPGLRNRPSSFDSQAFRLIVSFGGAAILLSLCLAANTTGVRWLMGVLASTSFVAHLAIILMPVMLLGQIIQAVTITVMPATSAYAATGNERMLRELLIRGMRYTTLLVLAGLIVAILLMRNVLAVWLGPEYVFLAPYALVLFASGSFMLSTSISHHMLKGLGRLRATVFISLTAVVIVPIGLILIVFWMWRSPYVAVASGLATGHIVYGVLLMLFGLKAVGAGFREAFMRAYVQPLFVAAAVCAVTVGLVTYVGVEGLLVRAIASLLAVLLLFLSSYIFIASATERQQTKELLQLAMGRILHVVERLRATNGHA